MRQLRTSAMLGYSMRLTSMCLRRSTRLHTLAFTGSGPVTWSYFLMLLGRPDVKPDTWIVRFVEQALGRPVAPTEAQDLLRDAAREMEVPASTLDHSVWSHIRAQAKRRRNTVGWQMSTDTAGLPSAES